MRRAPERHSNRVEPEPLRGQQPQPNVEARPDREHERCDVANSKGTPEPSHVLSCVRMQPASQLGSLTHPLADGRDRSGQHSALSFRIVPSDNGESSMCA